AFLVQVRLRNTGAAAVELRYTEAARARYQQIFSPWASEQHDIDWPAETPTELSGKTALVSFNARPKRKIAFPPPGQMSLLEQFPPALFVQSTIGDARAFAQKEASGT